MGGGSPGAGPGLLGAGQHVGSEGSGCLCRELSLTGQGQAREVPHTQQLARGGSGVGGSEAGGSRSRP